MRYAIALLLGAAVALPAHAQEKPAAANEVDARRNTVNAALDLIRGGKPAEAIAMLDPVLAAFDKDYPASGPDVFCASDTSSTLTGLIVRSAATQKDTIALGDSWCYALWGKAYSLIELGRIADAVPLLERAAALMPDNTQFQIELGYAHQQLKHWDASNAAYAAAADAAQGITDKARRNLALRRAWFGLGFNLIELGKLDEAESYFKKALTVAPGDQKILNELQYIKEQKEKGKRN